MLFNGAVFCRLKKTGYWKFSVGPDFKVENEYNKVLYGQDQQIEAAVKEMLKEIKENK